MKCDWQAIKSLLKSYVRAIAWLTLVTWAPSHVSCKISKLVGKMNWLTSLASLVIATQFLWIDTPSHRYETGLFFAPKVLEIIYGMLMMRGILFWNHAENKPRFTGQTIERIAIALTFGIFAILCGLNDNGSSQGNGARKEDNGRDEQ